MNIRYKLIFFYFLIALIFITGLFSIHRLTEKSALPFIVLSDNNNIYSNDDYKEIRKGNLILGIDNFPITNVSHIGFIIDTKLPGETAEINFSDGNGNSYATKVELVDFYSNNFFIIITLIIGLSFWLAGVYVISATPREKTARMLCLLLVTFALAILTPAGYSGRGVSDWLGYLIKITHPLSYIWGSVFFLHFSLIFPGRFLLKQKLILNLLYLTAFIFSIAIVYSFFISLRDLDFQYLKLYYHLWTSTQLFLLLSVIASTLILPLKYKRSKSKNEKAQLQWIFWGSAIGATPFIIFLLIPDIFGLPFLFLEEIVLAFLILIPVSFAIAVIKFRLFDIEVVIKRSIIYSLLITIIIFLYLGIIYLLSNFASSIIGEDAKFFNVLTAILIALIFNPLKDKVKKFVDSAFYKEKYFFDEAINRITGGMKECETLNALGKFLSDEIGKLVPVKSIAVIVKTSDGSRLKILEQKNFDELSKNIFALRVKKLSSKFNLPFALKNKINREVVFDSSLELVFRKWNINLVIPLTLGSNEVIGALVMGDKLSELKYSSSDVELLTAIASSAALALKKIQLQQKLLLEELEKTKHKELSELKSFFVASVSHDLKTPLSSIKIFSELLRNEKISREKSIEYLEIIEGETGRLERMINNVLDYARIERGIKKYTLEKIDLNHILNRVLNFMSYEFLMKQFEVEKNLSENDICINGNIDAINSLIQNLISNSIKYSDKTRYIKVSTSVKNNISCLCIEDKGVGISENNLKEIFNPFFRVNSGRPDNIKGAGLGLSIVKHILDAHNGVITVQSEVGKGSKFEIRFPGL